MEIYNEKVRDLLNSGTAGNKVHSLRVREHPIEGPYVEGEWVWSLRKAPHSSFVLFIPQCTLICALFTCRVTSLNIFYSATLYPHLCTVYMC